MQKMKDIVIPTVLILGVTTIIIISILMDKKISFEVESSIITGKLKGKQKIY